MMDLFVGSTWSLKRFKKSLPRMTMMNRVKATLEVVWTKATITGHNMSVLIPVMLLNSASSCLLHKAQLCMLTCVWERARFHFMNN